MTNPNPTNLNTRNRNQPTGSRTMRRQFNPVCPQPTASYGRTPSDTGSFGWAVLGFFIPLVGLILWMIWKNDRPGDAGMAGKGALVSVIINVVLFILWIVFAGILFAASGSY